MLIHKRSDTEHWMDATLNASTIAVAKVVHKEN
jgi:hypothetical protein